MSWMEDLKVVVVVVVGVEVVEMEVQQLWAVKWTMSVCESLAGGMWWVCEPLKSLMWCQFWCWIVWVAEQKEVWLVVVVVVVRWWHRSWKLRW